MFIKFIVLLLIFWTISRIGVKIANKYVARANNLKQIKRALKILEAKITYTYDMLPDLFYEITEKTKGPVSNLFKNTGDRMHLEFAGEAWENAIDNSDMELTDEDKDVLKSLGKLLGTTDMDGQLNQLNLVNCFLDEQIKEATKSKEKNCVMYRKLGIIVGLAVIIVLI